MGSSTEGLGYNDLPEEFQNLGTQVANYLSDALGGSNQTSGLTDQLTDIATNSGAGDYISSSLGGDYLDFESNEALQSAASGLTSDYSEGVTSSINDINRQAQAAGQFNSGTATTANVAATDKLTEDYLAELGSLYSDTYNTERGLQQDTLDSALGTYTDAITASNLGVSNVSDLLSAALGGSSLESGFGLK